MVIPPACNALAGVAVDRGELVLARAMIGVSLSALTLMVWLLITTPLDAIKLRFWVSVGLIFGGVLLSIAPLIHRNVRIAPVPTALTLLELTALFGLPMIFAMHRARHRASPWTVAPLLWHPLITIGGTSILHSSRWLPGAVPDGVYLVAAATAALTLLAVSLRRSWIAWPSWSVAAAATIVLTL